MTSSDIFEGINSIAQLGMALFVGLGVWVAYRQLEAWRLERRSSHKSMVAEELLGLALSVQDSFADVRNPFQSIPVEKAADKLVTYQLRYEKISKYNELFQKLRAAQIRVKASIGDQGVDEAVEALFKQRAIVATSIEEMADYVRDDVRDDYTRKRKVELRKIISSSSNDDEVGDTIHGSVQTLQEKLGPIVRFEV